MFLIPKSKRKVRKARKVLKRTPIKKGKRRFKEFGANPLKTYGRKRTDYQVQIHAEVNRQDRLRNRTKAEVAFHSTLTANGINFVAEKIIQNGDRYVLIDFYLPSHRLAIEIDGSSHDGRERYDMQRSLWLARKHGISTVRYRNKEVFSGFAARDLAQRLGLT